MFRALRQPNACKACALGMKGMKNELGQEFQVCKKAMQAQSQDMLKPIDPEFFRNHSIEDMKQMSGRELELLGRLTVPLYVPDGGTHFESIGWDEAKAKLLEQFRVADPSRTLFYVSGRSSNEAAFLLQLLARQFGTNHVNNCSYYCHQASGVGLGETFGSGTATVMLEDVEKADLVVLVGANPSSNHPRFMTHLMKLKKRKGKVVVINPFREVGLERFAVPSHVGSLLFPTEIASLYLQPHAGGDMSFFKAAAAYIYKEELMDEEFLRNYCNNVEEFLDDLGKTDIDKMLEQSGLDMNDLEQFVAMVTEAKNPIFAWAMGLTHHIHGVDTIRMLANLALMIGGVGRPGAGLLPLRGHSNVQGVGTVGVVPRLKPDVVDRFAKYLNLHVPEGEGYDTFNGMKAAERGDIDFGFFLGGNLYAANPASQWAEQAISKIGFTCQLSTTLNKGHLHGRGREALIIPVRARDEEPQGTTQESMFNYVRYSEGGAPPPVETLPSESQLLTFLGQNLFEDGSIDWKAMQDHDKIRETISKTIPGLEKLADIKREEFTIPNRIRHEPKFSTSNGKANLAVLSPPDARPPPGKFNLFTFRSEGQFNTIVYDDEDVYRGSTHRNVVFMNAEDITELGFSDGDWVKVSSDTGSVEMEIFEAPVRKGNVAMFFPEGNQVVSPVIDPKSKTPSFKKTHVVITKD